MNTRVRIAASLREYLDIPATVETAGGTVGECLEDLCRRYPAARPLLYDRNSMLQVVISLNNSETMVLNTKDEKRVLSPGDELLIFALMTCG
ncbi:MoaD/ThiS family protein [Chloroflexota bacterium]